MDWNQYFSFFILSVIAMHLAATIGGYLQSWWQELTIGKHTGQSVRDTDRLGLSAKMSGKQRSDWYVFFHCSDLVGKEPAEKKSSPMSQEKVASQSQRRSSARRLENRLTRT